jgi:serine/threonine-protein kinase RsbW
MTRRTAPPVSQPEWRQSLDTVTGPETLDRIQGCLNDLWADHGEIPDDVRMDVTVAAFEICSNIIEHSADGQPVRMGMELQLTPQRVEVVFTDDGKPAVVDLNSVSFPIDLADRGRGLAIAKEVLDELSYRRDNGRNQWVLAHRRFP